MTADIATSITGRLISNSSTEQVYEAQYQAKDPIITEHRIYGVVVVPGSLHVARLLCTISNVYKTQTVTITDILFTQPLIISETETRKVQLLIRPEVENTYYFRVQSLAAQTIVHAAGHFIMPKTIEVMQHDSLDLIQSRCNKEFSIAKFDDYFQQNMLQYETAYKWIEQIHCGNGESFSLMRAPIEPYETQWQVLQPGQIDCSFQTFISIIFDTVDKAPEKKAWVWAGAKNLRFFARASGKLRCHSILEDYQAFNSTSNKASGDITFYDASGAVIADFAGIVVAKVSQDRIYKLLHGA